MTHDLDYALRTIKTTMYLHRNNPYFPYFFIVGAGISVPEIPAASGIVEICKNTIREMDPEVFSLYDETSKQFANNGMKYYSSWIEYAYPNRIDRSQLFRKLCSKSKISSANLMLAQILHSGEFANTVFTTNFDDSIKKALDLMGTKNFFCAENAMDNLVVSNQTKDIQVVHVHGTYNFYDCANLEKEIDNVATQSDTISSARVLSSFLSNQAPIIVGYSGWENDVIMRCLKERLSFATPLQYIWICYDEQCYSNLPEWIKQSDSVIFVVPKLENNNCEEKCENLWDNTCNVDVIDATMFFKRIISTFQLKAPLIFTNPHLYYSKKIKSVLPQNEDVLHLRHWTQRLRILQSDDSFEQLVQRLETLYIAKDYVEANSVLQELCKLSLNEGNAEFVSVSLIREFIRDENIIPSFEQRLQFHLSSLQFIENNLHLLNNSKSLIATLRSILFIHFRYSEKDKAFELFDKVLALAQSDCRLLLIELTTLCIKSDFLSRDARINILKDVLHRCTSTSDDKDFVFLRYRVLCELSRAVCSDAAIPYIAEAETLAEILHNSEYTMSLYLAKSEILPHISNSTLREKWARDIFRLLASAEDGKWDQFLEITASLDALPEDILSKCTTPCEIESIVSKLLSIENVDLSRCHSILQYCQCCELVCKTSKDNSCISEYCHKIFETIPFFDNSCGKMLSLLLRTVYLFLSLPNDIADDQAKTSVMLIIRDNKQMPKLYYRLLSFISVENLIDNTEAFNPDFEYMDSQTKEVGIGYELYCDGKWSEAERIFLEALSCPIPHVANMARTDLAYMVRRGETESTLSFEEVIQKKSTYCGFDIMNILLYYVARGDTDSERYLKAKSELTKLEPDERQKIISWWSNVELVGEEESILALNLLNNI